MAAERNEKSWRETLSNDTQLWTTLQLPSHITDQQFIAFISKVCKTVVDLDCSDCSRLSQSAFTELAQKSIVLPNLRRLVVPSDVTLPNAVFEALAVAECFPALEELCDVEPMPVTDPIRCQAYFRHSKLRVLHDRPVAEYGRARKLLLQDSADSKQRRQRWELDLAKTAISCSMIDTYRCSRGLGYLDDKSIERLSVLFPRLRTLELSQCSVTDDGFAKFFAHNHSVNGPEAAIGGGVGSGGGGLKELVLDRPGHITDRTLDSVADCCSHLQSLSLSHCPALTNTAIRNVVSKCRELRELSLNLAESNLNNEMLATLGQNCTQLATLKLYNSSTFNSVGLASLLPQCHGLQTMVLESCHGVDDHCLELLAEHCVELAEFSLYSETVTARGLVQLLIRAHKLKSYHIHGNKLIQNLSVCELAEDTYNLLSDDISCRSSQLSSLKLVNVGHGLLQLMTALCSQLHSLTVAHLHLDAASTTNVLTNVVETCSQLKSFDIATNVPNITDRLLANICDHAVELRHLSLTVGHRTSVAHIGDLVQILPSLATVTLTFDSSSSTDADEQSKAADAVSAIEDLINIANKFHGDSCSVRVFNTSGSITGQQYQLSFVPLKYARCISQSTDQCCTLLVQ